MDLPERLASQLAGEEGPTRQKAARLVVDLAVTAGAEGFVNVDHAHVSGVSVITGGHGLRRFLSDLSSSGDGKVSIPTTLNSAGCDKEKMKEMDIDWPDFLEQQFEIFEVSHRVACSTQSRNGWCSHPMTFRKSAKAEWKVIDTSKERL